MTLAKIIEQLLLQTASNDALLRDNFSSLLEGSIKLKEVHEDMDDEDNEEAGDNDDDEEKDEDDDDDDDEDSDDEHEETEEEFLQRYAQAAAELENNGVLEKGDLEDQQHEINLEVFQAVSKRWGHVDVAVIVCGPPTLQTSVAREIRSHNLRRDFDNPIFHFNGRSFDL